MNEKKWSLLNKYNKKNVLKWIFMKFNKIPFSENVTDSE